MSGFINFETFDPNTVTRRPLNLPITQNPIKTDIQEKLSKYLQKHSGSLHKRILLLGEESLVAQILQAIEHKDFAKADSLYLKLSIGESAWPIGGINLGIVQQSERKVANNPQAERLTNDSITELKRLINLERLA